MTENLSVEAAKFGWFDLTRPKYFSILTKLTGTFDFSGVLPPSIRTRACRRFIHGGNLGYFRWRLCFASARHRLLCSSSLRAHKHAVLRAYTERARLNTIRQCSRITLSGGDAKTFDAPGAAKKISSRKDTAGSGTRRWCQIFTLARNPWLGMRYGTIVRGVYPLRRRK